MSEVEIEDDGGLLSPLLEKGAQQDSEFRLRRSPWNFKSIHPSDIDEWAVKGWQEQRAGKRSTRIKKAKVHDQALEDRIWTLFYRIGFDRMNGSQFKIKFKRNDGSQGKKQIDVFAHDGETAIVIECKSKSQPGPRNLSKDIQETIALQQYIRKSIFGLFDAVNKPKIIWLYATKNIRWSEPDVERANDGGISILTENEIAYYETFIKHIGPAGKYQILSEYLKGQKIPGLGDVQVPAVRGTIGGEIFYSFVTTPRSLLKVAFINHQALDHPDGTPAYQRMINSKRIKNIGKFIRLDGFFATNLLVNFMDTPRFDPLPKEVNNDPNIKFGLMTLPAKYRSAWIIDGQHRLYGYSGLPDKFLDQSIFVLAFDQMETHREADLFVTINHKQKSVPTALLDSLLAEIRLGDPDPSTNLSALSSAVVKSLNADKTSPMYHRFQKPDVPAEPSESLTISEAKKELKRSGLVGKVLKKNKVPGVFCGQDDAGTINRTRKILNGYFTLIRDANPVRWEGGKSAYVCVNPGIRAHIRLIVEMINYVSLKKGLDFAGLTEDKVINEFAELVPPICDMLRSSTDQDIQEKFKGHFGEGGVRQYLFRLVECIYEERQDFGSDDFHRFIEQRGSNLVEETDQFVLNFSQDMLDYIIAVLKSKYGTHQLPSGEPAYWENGIPNAKIKKEASNRQIDDEDDRRSKKEAYLFILDLKKIVEHPNNWGSFKGVFNAPEPTDKINKTRKYTGWMAKFNDIRRIPAHKSSIRTYKDEDFVFIDWLRVTVAPRLDEALGRNH